MDSIMGSAMDMTNGEYLLFFHISLVHFFSLNNKRHTTFLLCGENKIDILKNPLPLRVL